MGCNVENALYSVATPIGNLDDMSKRAIDILSNVDIIACEDTRNSSVLLEKYNIKTRLISYHKYSENSRCELFLGYLKEGKSIALISDAGTPLISDPGSILVEEVLNNGFKVIPVVGASAPIALLSAIPRESEDFKFIGFLPKNKSQIIEIVAQNKYENLIFYESPNRIIDTLKTIQNEFPNKKIALGRELTKKFEEIKIGTINEIIKYYETNILKGEIVAMIYKENKTEDIDLSEQIKKLKTLNLKDKEIASILSSLYSANKNSIYKKCLEI